MLDLYARVRAEHFDPMVPALHVSRKVRQKELAIQQQRQLAEERLGVYRSDRTLKERPPSGLIR
jgi:hypothetical protein